MPGAANELLERIAHASDEEKAAIRRLLAGPALTAMPPAPDERDCRSCFAQFKAVLERMDRKLDALQKTQKTLSVVECEEELDDDELRRIYGRVITLSDSECGEREVSLKAVFDCYCGKGLSAVKTAAALGCCKATIINRLADLKAIAGVAAHKLRTYQPTFERIEQSLRDPRARRACGKHAALGDEPECFTPQ